IALKVTAPRPAPLVPENVPVRMLPASFYEQPATDAVLAPPAESAWSPWLLAVLLVSPLLTVAGVRGWRRLFPDHGQAHRRQRSQAAQRALQALHRTNDEPAWIVLGRYLRERLDFAAAEPTPAELRPFLRRRGASRPMAERLA